MADEFDLIERFFTTPAEPGDGVWLGIGDDAAVLEVPPGHLVVDAMICRPIPAAADARAFASRAVKEALARLHTRGAEPRWMTLALTLPAPDERWLEGFSRAVRDTARRHRVRLVGGDTTQGPGALSVSVFGLVPEPGPAEREAIDTASRPGRAPRRVARSIRRSRTGRASNDPPRGRRLPGAQRRADAAPHRGRDKR